jgi:phosphomevalonate kinase
MDKEKFLNENLPELAHLASNITGIFICGLRGSGKTSLANLIQATDSRFKVLSFAAPLKIEFARKFGIRLQDLESRESKETHRFDLQRFSEEMITEDPFYLVRLLFKDVKEGDRIVCDDMRTLFELQAALALGCVPYQTYADPKIRAARGIKPNKEADNHFLELELGSLCPETLMRLGGATINNNGPIENLKAESMDLVRKHYTLPILV